MSRDPAWQNQLTSGATGQSPGSLWAAVQLPGVGEEYSVCGQVLREPHRGAAESSSEPGGCSSRSCPPPTPARAWPSSSPPTASACPWSSSWCGGGQAWLRLPRGHSHRLCGQLCHGYDHQQCAGRVQEGADLALAMSFTVFSPISSFVPKEKIPGPHNPKLWPKVNGKLRQEV